MKQITFALLFSGLLYADTIGGEVSLGLFNHSSEGTTRYQALHSVDVVDTLAYGDSQDIFLQAYIEHPFPFLPNVKLSYNPLSHNDTTIVSNFSWGDIGNYDGRIESSLSMDYADATFYYELLDNWVEIDTGLTFRYLNGTMSVASTHRQDSVSYSTFFPLLYGKARFNIPSTNVSLQAEANILSLSSTSSYDYALSARYTLEFGLGLEAGYKLFHIDSDDLENGFHIDTSFSGIYASAVWDF